MARISTKQALSISCGLHVVILLLGVVYWTSTAPTLKRSESGSKTQTVMLMWMPPDHVTTREKKQDDIVLKKSKAHPLKKATSTAIKTTKQASSPAARAEGLSKEVHDALLEKLHHAIAKHQSYPDEAIALEQSGKVRLGFLLLLDGQIRNAHILSSSGATSLDRAALIALQKAAPFREIEQHLKKPEHFEITLVFTLA